MRATALGLLAAALAACAAGGQGPCGYPARETSICDARLSFAYRYFDDPATPAIDVDSGRLAANYAELEDSPNSGFSLAASTELALAGFVPSSWLGQGTSSYRIYPWSKANAFLFGGLEAVASTGLPQPGLDARVGLGFGRFRDVTPLAKAIEIGETLLSMGAIPERLSEGTVLAVAHMIERASEYPTPGTLLADMESIVEFDAGTQLDVWTLRVVEDLALRQGHERCCGWVVQAGVGYELLDPFDGEQNLILAGSGDAAYASSPRDQFLAHVSFSGPPAILDENSLVGSASYALDFGERQTLTAEYAVSRIQPQDAAAMTTHWVRLGLVFSLSRGSVGLQVSVSHRTGEAGWAIDVSMAAALDLL